MILRGGWIVILGFCLCINTACSDRQAGHTGATFSGETMGVPYTVRLTDLPYFSGPNDIEKIIESTLQNVDNRLSVAKDGSELSFINHSRDLEQALPLSPEITGIISEAMRIGMNSGGAYDITAAPLADMWAQARAKNATPTDAEIQAMLARVGQDKMVLDAANRLFRKHHTDLYLDLSSAVPGHAADMLAQALEKMQIQNYMINVGGAIRVRGINQGGEPWRIPVERVAAAGLQQHALQPNEAGMATAGNYRDAVDVLDARTGRMVQHDPALIVVVAPSAASAHMWTAALTALGPEQGYSVATQANLAASFLIGKNGGVEEKATPGFVSYLVDLNAAPAPAAAQN
jgi:thiamine biosynthesis lipoprotein